MNWPWPDQVLSQHLLRIIEGYRKNPVWISSFLAEIRTEHLPNESDALLLCQSAEYVIGTTLKTSCKLSFSEYLNFLGVYFIYHEHEELQV